MTFPAQLEVNRLLRRETSSSQALAQSFDQSTSSVNLTNIPSANENFGSTADEDIYVIGDARKRPKTARFSREKDDVSPRVRPWSSPFRPYRSSRIVPRGTNEPTAGAVAATQPREETAVSSLTAAFSVSAPRPGKETTQRKTSTRLSYADRIGDANAALESSNTPTLISAGTSEGRSMGSSSFGSTALDLETEVSKNDKRLEARAMMPVPTISVDGEDEDRTAPWHSLPNNARTSVCSSTSQISSLERSGYVTERIHQLVTAFGKRASRVKAQITQPPTPSTELSDGEDEAPKPPGLRERVDSPDPSSRPPSVASLVGVSSKKARLRKSWRRFKTFCSFPDAIDPQGTVYIGWLLVVALCFTYNAWVVPLRSIFTQYQTPSNLASWLTFDYLCDLVYLFDVVFVKTRIKYIDSGFWVKDAKLMRRHYIKGKGFPMDVASLLPLDLLYLRFGCWSFFRLPRLLRMRCFWEFFDRLDSVLSSPHVLRVVRTLTYMLYLIHLNTCAYYGFSKVEGIGVNRWVFQGEGNAYIRCFYFATKTATSIGKNPKPENEAEYLFMTCSWLLGVFVFALLIGQIRDILATATRSQNEYQKVMDQTQVYLHRLNVPPSLQHRVRQWFSYTWQNQKTLDEMRALSWLPKKMRMDLALHVHMRTLSKVQLFQDCDKALLRDLVLKLRPVLYLPGDYVCKKGEVGKEMYIVMAGEVQVKGPDDVTLASLGQGSVFGEISLLALAGGNRRTADVRSRGFSNLFVLSKADLQATIKDYPEAQEILKKKAKRLIKQNEERERKAALSPDVIIKSRQSTPRILHTVLQVVRPDSLTADVIRRSSRYFTKSQCDLRSPGLPSWPSSSVTSPRPPFPSSDNVDTDSRRSSMETQYVRSKHRTSSLGVTSLSESFAEEEEEEYLVVETTEVGEDPPEGGPLSPVPASPRSQHSISLQRSSSALSDASGRSRAVSITSTPRSIRSVSSTPRSLGSTVRYSPMSLTRQARVSSMEDPRSPEDQQTQEERKAGEEEESATTSSLVSTSLPAQPKDETKITRKSSPTLLSQCETPSNICKKSERRTSSCIGSSTRRNSNTTAESDGASHRESQGVQRDRSERTRSSKKGRRSSSRSTSMQVIPVQSSASPRVKTTTKAKSEDNSVKPTRRGSEPNSRGGGSAGANREGGSTNTSGGAGSCKSQRKFAIQGKDKSSSSRKPRSVRASPGKGPKSERKPLQGNLSHGSSTSVRDDAKIPITESTQEKINGNGSTTNAQERKLSGNKYPRQDNYTKPSPQDLKKMMSQSGESGILTDSHPSTRPSSSPHTLFPSPPSLSTRPSSSSSSGNGSPSSSGKGRPVPSAPDSPSSSFSTSCEVFFPAQMSFVPAIETSSGECSPLLTSFSPDNCKDSSAPKQLQQLSTTSVPDHQRQQLQQQQLHDPVLEQQVKLSRRQDDVKMSSVPTTSSSSFETTTPSTVSCAAIVHREDSSSLPRPPLPRPLETLRQGLLHERTQSLEAKQEADESKL